MNYIKNILTVGASGRIENKVAEFENLRNDYERLFTEMEKKREIVNLKLVKVIQVKVRSVEKLKKINRIAKNLNVKDREILISKFDNEFKKINFNRIEETITFGDQAINATKGLSAGVGTALGAWALASTLGTASTGTAIASLSGVAATNATLAWFGGGAVAAGGGGMAAGTMALGGIIALPALILTGVFSHIGAKKKIREIEEKMLEVIESIDIIKSNLLKLDLIEIRSEEIVISLEKSIEVFEIEFTRIYKKIYPVPFISRFIKWVRKNILRMKYYTKKDVENIAYIGGIASRFASLIDTKIFE